MLNFDNIEDLVVYMFDKVADDESVSVVVNKDLAISILTELLEYNDVILKYADVDGYEYDKEYIVTLNADSDLWGIAIEPIYNYEKEMYFATDGYVLFHEDVNSKALIDMRNNENVEITGHDWFVVGREDEKENETDYKDIKELDHKPVTTSTYRINGQEVSKDTYENELGKIEDMYLDNIRDMLLGYAEVIDEMNEWRKLLRL